MTNKGSVSLKDIPTTLPILPVRETVLFPGAVQPLTVGRESSLGLFNSRVQLRHHPKQLFFALEGIEKRERAFTPHCQRLKGAWKKHRLAYRQDGKSGGNILQRNSSLICHSGFPLTYAAITIMLRCQG